MNVASPIAAPAVAERSPLSAEFSADLQSMKKRLLAAADACSRAESSTSCIAGERTVSGFASQFATVRTPAPRWAANDSFVSLRAVRR